MLIETARKFPTVHEIKIENQKHYEKRIEITKTDDDIVTIFLKFSDGNLKTISSYSAKFSDIKEGYKLVYLGKMFDIYEI